MLRETMMSRIAHRVFLVALLSGAMALPALANKDRETKKSRNESATTDRSVARQPLDYLPLFAGDRQILIECVLVEGPSSTLAMTLGAGSVAPEEISLGLGESLPVIGGLFKKDGGFMPDEFGPENRVGTAAIAGSVLAVSLRPDGQITAGGSTPDRLCAAAEAAQPASVPVDRAIRPLGVDVGSIVVANRSLIFQLRGPVSTFDHATLVGAAGAPATATTGSGTGVPKLTDLPLIATEFRSAGSAHVRDRKLMILITPTVLSDGDM
jgi:hypothetical protein